MFLIIQFGSTKTPAIKSCLELLGQEASVAGWENIPERPSNLKGIVFSGSPTFLTEVDHSPYINLISPLLEWNVPILGICFGHQVLGILHGAKIFRGNPVRRQEKINLVEQDVLFKEFEIHFQMAEDHTEGIDVPAGFIHVASSESYHNEAMKHHTKKFWGVQFHPEVSGEIGLKLFSNFISLCKESQ
jgi:GMP synthase (glutamine-hydrolysing)